MNKKLTVFQYIIAVIVFVSVLASVFFVFFWLNNEKKRYTHIIEETQSIFIESKKQTIKTVVEQFLNHIQSHFKYEKKITEDLLNDTAVVVKSLNSEKEVLRFLKKRKKEIPIMNYAVYHSSLKKIVYASCNFNPTEKFCSPQKDFIVYLKTECPKAKLNICLFVKRKEFLSDIQSKLLSFFKDVKFENSGYLFILDTSGNVILSAHKIYNKKIEEISPEYGKQAKEAILRKIKKDGKGFVQYFWFKPGTDKVGLKLSYVVYSPEYRWIIGAGMYYDDMNRSFAKILTLNRKEFLKNIRIAAVIWILIISIGIILSFVLVGEGLRKDFATLNLIFKQSTVDTDTLEKISCADFSFKETCVLGKNIKETMLSVKNFEGQLFAKNRELEEINKKFEILTENVSNGVLIIDKNFDIVYANNAIGTMLGKDRDSLLGRNLFEFVEDKYKKQIAKRMEKGSGNSEVKIEIELKTGINSIIAEMVVSEVTLKGEEHKLITLVDITEVKNLLEHLSFLKNQFEKAEQMAKVGNWIYYPKDKLYWASREFFRIYGFFYEEGKEYLPARKIQERIHPEDVEIARKTIIEPLNRKVNHTEQFRLVMPGGRIKYIESQGEPVLDENGEVIRVEGVLKDITDIKTAELQIRKYLNILEQSQKTARLGYWEYFVEKEKYKFSAAFLKDVIPFEEMSKEELLNLIYSEDREQYQKTIVENYKATGESSVTFRIKSPITGKIHYIYAEGKLVFNEKGDVYKREGIIQDITKLKELEQKIKVEEQKLKKTLDALNEVVILTNENYQIIYFNKKLFELFGDRDILGKSMVEFLSGLGLEGLPERLSKEDLIKIIDEGEKFVYHKGNSEFILTLGFSEIFEDNNRLGCVFVINDITHQEKYIENAIKVENMKTINKLAASLAHDFNNLLGSVLGKLSLVKLETKDEKVVEEMEKIMRNMKIAKALATQFLTFSKSGKPIIRDIEQSTVKQIIDDLCDFVFSGSSVKVTKNVEKKLWPIKGDNTQLAQLLLNLLTNAKDALNGKGKVKIEVRNYENKGRVKELPKGKYVLLKVSDDGPGIPEEKLKEIFNFFVGFKKTGFGLGLAIVNSIVKAHKGYLDIQSKVGEGTTFYIYLPAGSEVKKKVKPKKKKRLKIASEIREKIKNKAIAILEDEAHMQEMIYDLLEFMEIEGDIFQTGEELLESVKKNKDRYLVAVLDLTVKGGKGGAEIIEDLKKEAPHIKTIVSSGYSQGPVMAEYKKYGFDGVLAKPYTYDDFLSILSELL